jgi:SAM-dependent methyltransferase
MYDKIILDHYANVASIEGHLDSCTMADDRIREIETQFIIESIEKILQEFHNGTDSDRPVILDAGCGNGFTLQQLSKNFVNVDYKGIEFTPELREIANNKGLPCKVMAGDIRSKETLPTGVDILILQRVLINLLDPHDQIAAVRNLLASIKKGGYLIAIEAFTSGLSNLNQSRKELGLPNIPPAHHNLYLEDNFFEKFPELSAIQTNYGPNILSSHYFITRVLHDVALSATGSNFVRNSMFVKFFDEALPLGIGQFSPLKCLLFKNS